jgi:hypothetical protein
VRGREVGREEEGDIYIWRRERERGMGERV